MKIGDTVWFSHRLNNNKVIKSMGLVHQVSTAFGYMAVLKLKIAQPSIV